MHLMANTLMRDWIKSWGKKWAECPIEVASSVRLFNRSLIDLLRVFDTGCQRRPFTNLMTAELSHSAKSAERWQSAANGKLRSIFINPSQMSEEGRVPRRDLREGKSICGSQNLPTDKIIICCSCVIIMPLHHFSLEKIKRKSWISRCFLVSLIFTPIGHKRGEAAGIQSMAWRPTELTGRCVLRERTKC